VHTDWACLDIVDELQSVRPQSLIYRAAVAALFVNVASVATRPSSWRGVTRRESPQGSTSRETLGLFTTANRGDFTAGSRSRATPPVCGRAGQDGDPEIAIDEYSALLVRCCQRCTALSTTAAPCC
jgi:hypothetical protein